jgi:hypothetical protein
LLANHGDFADLPRLRKESEEKTWIYDID